LDIFGIIPIMQSLEARDRLIALQSAKNCLDLTKTDEILSIPGFTPAESVILGALWSDTTNEETKFRKSVQFLKFLTLNSKPALGHASSNMIKPCTTDELDQLANALNMVDCGSLEQIRTVPPEFFSTIFFTAVSISGQTIDCFASESSQTPEQVFQSEFVDNFPPTE
jgi:hypothetical protein